ncbi:hypothetical protein [Streptomyces sp. A1136]|uniref:hypothetical protein n=1 Tax=Streptomyces sp. A1136 TaxID=2563102 RepID=UPI00109E4D86|nr:hypothetical protein [Streptomyces sp. A1136]THA56123.1 hypothetical protein E6R62_12315 [Streptomyces sp. A1136]
MTTSTATTDLRTITTLWPALQDTLDGLGTQSWPPAGRADLLRALDTRDADEVETDRRRAVLRRAAERSPEQIGTVNAPIDLRVYDTMRLVETTLVHLADTLAPQITRPAISHAPADWETRGWTAVDRALRNQCADDEQADPRRWRYVGLRTAEYAAGWLDARVRGMAGPFWMLTAAQLHHVEQVAAGCRDRVERALDLVTQERILDQPCSCGGRIVLRTGAGAPPMARCAGCERLWTMADTAAA